MEFSIVKLFPDNLIQALCNTLLHSLWQGVILAVITAIIIVSTRKSSPARRYNLLIASLVLFAAGTVATFVVSLKHAPALFTGPVNYHSDVITTRQAAPVIYHEIATAKTTLTDTAIGYFNRNSATIVLIWFLMVCARSLQLATGLQGVYYLRRRNIFKADELWQKRVQHLADELGIRRAIKIAESGLAKVPMVVGHLKPLILIPVGLLTAMSAEEIEAILVHELAHIRRSDYLVNLLQSLLEIIFFFNPAVLWVSSLIKTERENCCDDIAVSQSSSKVNYIKALVACQEYNCQSSPALAMALNGKNTPLKTRVTRIISNNNQSLNRMEKALLAICLVTAGLCTAAFTNAEKINKLVANTAKAVTNAGSAIKREILPGSKTLNVKKPVEPNAAAQADTNKKARLMVYKSKEIGEHTAVTFANNGYITRLYKENGVLYQFNYKGEVLASMQVDGKPVNSRDMARYQAIIDQVPHEKRSQYGEIHDEADDKATADRTDNATMSRTDSATQLYKAQHSNSAWSLGKLNGKLSSQQQTLNGPKSLYSKDSTSRAYKKSANDYRLFAGQFAKQNGVYVKKPMTYKIYPKLSNGEKEKAMINELINDGIIQSANNLSFKISTRDFIVNGKRQPGDVYQKYLSQFINELATPDGIRAWLYNFDDNAKVEDAIEPEESVAVKAAIAPIAKKTSGYDKSSYVKLKDDERRDKMISELMIDGIINSKNNLSFKISTSEFIVNGKKQPDDVYQKYKTHFVKNTTGVWSWAYNYDDAARRESNTIVDEPNQH